MSTRAAGYRHKTVKGRRRRVDQTVAFLQGNGWTVSSRRPLRRGRSEVTLRRDRARWQTRPTIAFGVAIVTLSILASIVAWGPPMPWEGGQQPKRSEQAQPASAEDSDGDGLSDAIEIDGFRTANGRLVRTDPGLADSDNDGLSDGMEAGQVRADPTWGAVYALRSDPTSSDSDGDGLDDATELDGGFDAWAADSDADGLDDLAELEHGSDPLQADADGDGATDALEMARGTDPWSRDLSTAGGAEAFLLGAATFGQATLADRLGLDEQQLESWQFLLGSLLKRLLPVPRFTAVVARVRAGDWPGVLTELAASTPGSGIAVKVVQDVAKFAGRSDGALRGALRAVSQLPLLTESAQVSLVRQIVRLAPDASRLAVDAEHRDRTAPAALLISRPVSEDPEVEAAKESLLRTLASAAYTDMRVNERQVTAAGLVVGEVRPDVQATDPDGTRHYYVLDRDGSASSAVKIVRLIANDDGAEVHLVTP